MMSLSRGLGLVAIALILPFSMRYSNFVTRQVDSTYSDSACYLKLVKDTNEDHYKLHPVWSAIEPQTSCNTMDYLEKNSSARIEQFVNMWVTQKMGLLSLLALVPLLWMNKPKLLELMVLLFYLDRMSQEVQGYVHIVNDITQMNGTILHHVPIWGGATQSNPGEGLKPIGEGMACTLIFSQMGYMIATYLIVKSSRYNAAIATAMFWPVNVASSVFQMMKHHEVHKMGDAAAVSLNPLDRWYYKCHIQGHHLNGLFCSHANPGLVLHDPMASLLGHLLKAGYMQHGTWAFEAVMVGVEVFIFAASVGKMLLALWFFAKVHAKIERAMCGKQA